LAVIAVVDLSMAALEPEVERLFGAAIGPDFQRQPRP